MGLAVTEAPEIEDPVLADAVALTACVRDLLDCGPLLAVAADLLPE